MLILSASGCHDLATAPQSKPAPVSPRLNELPDEWQGGEDPPTEWPVEIHAAGSSIVMPPASAGTALIESWMEYQAFHASISGSAVVNDGVTSSNLTFGPQEKHTFNQFLNNHHQAEFPVPVRKACGTWVQANIEFKAWWRGNGLAGQITIDDDLDVRYPRGEQAACPENEVEDKEVPAPTGGGSGGGDAGTTGYSRCWVRYWYDVETGEVLHTTLLFCY